MYQCHRADKDFAMPPAVSQVSGTRDAVLEGKPGIMFPTGLGKLKGRTASGRARQASDGE